jgi:hypothetical protein
MESLKVKKNYKKSSFEGRESYRKAWLVLMVLVSSFLVSQAAPTLNCADPRDPDGSSRLDMLTLV